MNAGREFLNATGVDGGLRGFVSGGDGGSFGHNALFDVVQLSPLQSGHAVLGGRGRLAVLDPDNGSVGVVQEGGATYMGTIQPAGTSSFAWRAFNLDPVGLNVPIVKIRTRLGIVASTNGRPDAFGFGIYNRASQLLCAVFFDTATGEIYYDSGTGPQTVGLTFSPGFFMDIAMTLNFATNRGTLSLFDAAGQEYPIFQNTAFNGSGVALDLGDIDYLWILNSTGTAGDNRMVVDSLSVEAQANPSISVAKGTKQRAKRDSYILRGGQASADDVRIEWKSKQQWRWTAVRGTTTNWTIRLRRLQKGRNIVQLRMLDALGRTIDETKVTVLRK